MTSTTQTPEEGVGDVGGATATPTPTPTDSIHVVSARTSNNPFATLDLACVQVKTREHAQLAGVFSFALFICLTVASFMLYNVTALFFIVVGIVVYAFLAESLFKCPRPCGVLAYLIFETVQIGVYIATLILIVVTSIFGKWNDDEGQQDDCNSPSSTTTSSSAPTPTATAPPTVPCVQPITDAPITAFSVVLLAFTYVLLLVIKVYFIRVFTRFYKFILFQSRHANDLRAQYVLGRGVNIRFPVGDPSVISDPSYGYGMNPRTPLPDLPSYHEAMRTSKPPSAPVTADLPV